MPRNQPGYARNVFLYCQSVRPDEIIIINVFGAGIIFLNFSTPVYKM